MFRDDRPGYRGCMRTPSSFLLALVVLLGLAGSQDAHATTYREMCTSVPDECEYSGPDAPVLASNVCWSRTTSQAVLMSGATCPSGSWPYFVKYGVVDPLTQVVTGLVPLDYVCSRPGLCTPGSFAPPNTTTEVACCIAGACWPIEEAFPCEGEVLLCLEGVTNEDGTITCFDE